MKLVNIAKFKEYRGNAGFSQNELGKIAGVSTGTVSHIERTGHAREKSLKQIADVLGVRVSDLTVDEFPPAHEIRETRIPYGNPCTQLLNLSMAKIDRAGLTENEREQLRRIIAQVVDIFTINNHPERKRYTEVIAGAIKLYHQAVFPSGGREDVILSDSEEKKGG